MSNAKFRAVSHSFKLEERKERKRVRRQGRADKRAFSFVNCK
ncbi:MAG: hypothetical protein O9972_39650 [Burkholderiales bacterium]|nr:hypothetical protein [Burkholderiales bacterium]